MRFRDQLRRRVIGGVRGHSLPPTSMLGLAGMKGSRGFTKPVNLTALRGLTTMQSGSACAQRLRPGMRGT
jgi:hypothetical protein